MDSHVTDLPQESAKPGRNTIVHGASLMVLMRVISRLIGIVSTTILARLLTPDDFGLVVLGTSILNVVQMLSELSLGAALIRMRNVTRDHYDTAWTIGLIRGALVAGLIVATAPFAAEAMHEPRVSAILWTLAIATVIQSLENIRLVDFQMRMEFGGVFRYQFVGRVASFLTTLVLAIILRNYWALVISTVVTSVATISYSYVMISNRPRLCLKAWRDLFDFSKWAVLGAYLAVIDNYSITFLMGWIGGVRELGLYQVSAQIAALPASEIAAPIRPPLYAEFARLAAQPAELARTFVNGFGFLFLVIVPMSLGIFVTAPMIAPLALGSQWTGAPAMIQAVVFYALFDAFGHYPQNLFVVMNRQPRLLVLAVIFLSVRVPAAIYGGWVGGPIGAVYGMVATALFGSIFWFLGVRPLVSASVWSLVRASWRSAAAGALMVAALLALQQVWPLATGAVALAVRFLVFVALGAIVHVGALMLLWWWCGCPDGAEAKAVRIAEGSLSRIRRRGLSFV